MLQTCTTLDDRHTRATITPVVRSSHTPRDVIENDSSVAVMNFHSVADLLPWMLLLISSTGNSSPVTNKVSNWNEEN